MATTKKPITATKTASTVKKAVVKTPKISVKAKTVKADKVVPTVVTIKKLSIPQFDIDGKSVGSLDVPVEIFGATVNQTLIAQAVRVYLTNQRAGNANTKTRGEVRGGGKKPWKQKGTGRARAGSTRSPLWVGGGTTFGPQTHLFSQTLPKKMRLKALSAALSQKLAEDKIVAIKGLETLPAKTAKVAKAINSLPKSSKYLILLDKKRPEFQLGARNISGVSTKSAVDLTTYNLINGSTLVVTAESLKALIQRWI